MHSTLLSPVDAAAAVDEAVGALVGSVSGGAVRDLDHQQLGDLVQSLRRDLARLESVQLEAVGEVDARGSHVHDGALTAAAWLRMLALVTPAEAAGAVRTARVLRTGVLPRTRAALADGAISGRHAQVIAGAVVDAPAGAVALIEPEAVAAATEADVQAVANLMRAFGHALDPDAADAAAVRRYERAGVTFCPTLNGSMAISGLADEVTGSLIATAVDTAAPQVRGDTRTAARRRLDGLAEIARRYLADPHAPRRGGGGHPHLIVTVDQTTLRTTGGASAGNGADSNAGRGQGPVSVNGSPGATLSWIGRIAGATAGRVGCDAMTTLVTIGTDGEVTEAGTSRRFFTPAQRRAIIARDGDRCGWPWCDRPIAWSDAHHLTPVDAGGPTTVANGTLPCEAHHLYLHEGGWQLQRLPDGRYLARHPATGRTLGPEPHPPGHNRPPPAGE
jgi:hypothetical protein